MSIETRQTNKSVGSITMVNLTGNELEVWVNSSRTSHIIPKMVIDHTEYKENHPSPVVGNTGEVVGIKPATRVFLRAIEKRAGYFHNNFAGKPIIETICSLYFFLEEKKGANPLYSHKIVFLSLKLIQKE